MKKKKSINYIQNPKYPAWQYKTAGMLIKIILVPLLVLISLPFLPILPISIILGYFAWKTADTWLETAKMINLSEKQKEEAKMQRVKEFEQAKLRIIENEKKEEERKANIRQKEAEYLQTLKSFSYEKVLCFDIETTGLNPEEDEILQLSIINGNGDILFNDYIKPTTRKRWPNAQKVHGITYQMVKDKDTIDKHISELNQIFSEAEVITGYNIEGFDLEFIENAGISIPRTAKIVDVMLKFAEIYGEWNDYYGNFKWQKLEKCASYYKYQKQGDYHDSLEDVRATLFCYFAMLEDEFKPKKSK